MLKQTISSRWTWIAICLALSAAAAAPPAKAQSRSITIEPGENSWLGVDVKDVTAASAEQMKLPGIYGAIVESVEPNSPAAKAGIEKNDVILKYAGERVFSAAALSRMVRETPPGRAVSIEVSREGAMRTLEATIEKSAGNMFFFNRQPFQMYEGPHFKQPPESERFRAMPLPNPQSPWSGFNFRYFNSPAVLGVTGEDLTPQLARFFGVAQGKGVLVTEVTAGSPAAMAGIKAGDVITKVGSKEVGSVEELRGALGEESNEPRKVMLTVVRYHKELLITVNLKPPQQQIQSAADWQKLGISRQDAEMLASLVVKSKLKSAEYQRELRQMQEQLKRELEPLRQELRQELQQVKAETRKEIKHQIRIERQPQEAHVI